MRRAEDMEYQPSDPMQKRTRSCLQGMFDASQYLQLYGPFQTNPEQEGSRVLASVLKQGLSVMAIDVLTIGFHALHFSWFAKPGVTSGIVVKST